MRRLAIFSVGLFGLWIVTASGCSGDKCPPGDLDCFLDRMVLVEPTDDGAPMGLVPVSANKISPSGGGQCTGTLCNGLCVSTNVDPKNCGFCGNVCLDGGVCMGGACACPAGLSQCNGACVDHGTDPSACGYCGNVCLGGHYCTNGQCQTGCDVGRTACGAACVDTNHDPRNCGGCDQACGTGMTCSNGACQCTSPSPCGCVDFTTDPQNCGGCGVVCPSGQVCSGGACAPESSAGPPPSIDNAPPPVAIGEPGELAPLDLEFTDPNGCAPAFCTRLCNNAGCTSGYRCTRPKRDGIVHGTWRSYLGFLAEPADATETFTTGVVPISAPGCPEDLVDQMAADTIVTAAVGVEVQIATTVAHQTGSGGGGGDEYCYTVSGFCNCTVDMCADGAGQCWYDTSAGRFPCAAGCNCAAAASGVVNTCCPHP